MQMDLDRLEPEQRGMVTQMQTTPKLKRRLRDFGLVEGTEVRVRYRSPDGGVTALELRGTVIALRTRELKKIRVRLL